MSWRSHTSLHIRLSSILHDHPPLSKLIPFVSSVVETDGHMFSTKSLITFFGCPNGEHAFGSELVFAQLKDRVRKRRPKARTTAELKVHVIEILRQMALENPRPLYHHVRQWEIKAHLNQNFDD